MESSNPIVKNAMAARNSGGRFHDREGRIIKKGDYVIPAKGRKTKPLKISDTANKEVEDWVLLEDGRRLDESEVIFVGHRIEDTKNTGMHRLLKRYISGGQYADALDVVLDEPEAWIPNDVRASLVDKLTRKSRDAEKLVDALYWTGI